MMEFDSNRPIWLQIYHVLCERILSGYYAPQSRIPSVREYGAEIGVNPNTVMRTYEKLTADGIVFNKRGIGYFVSENAREVILSAQRKEFMENDVPAFLRRMRILGIHPAEINFNQQEI